MGCGSSKEGITVTVQLNGMISQPTGVPSVDNFVRRQNDLITGLAKLTDDLDRKRARLCYLTGYHWNEKAVLRKAVIGSILQVFCIALGDLSAVKVTITDRPSLKVGLKPTF